MCDTDCLMTTLFNSIDDLVGQPCTHGSPGYPVKETIVHIGQTDETGMKHPIWKITFESGCFTYIFAPDLDELVNSGEIVYRRAKHFDAIEEIRMIDLADDPRFYPSEKDWE